MTTEEPTNELRQVWTEAWRQCSDGRTISYFGYYTVQRKWIIHEEVDPSFPHGGKIGRDEWRDIPIVDAKDAK